MKIIDAHVHFSNIKSFHDASVKSKVDYSLKGFLKEFKGITAVGMGLTESNDPFPDSNAVNPMKLDLDDNPNNLHTCLGYNPLTNYNIKAFENDITDNTVGLKIYAGYYHYHVWDDIYSPLYELARRHSLPVVIHSGDTYSRRGLLKYAHPLEIDELAVKYPDVIFIIAHFGDPWIMDAAEVAAKNPNVYIDLSGLIVGDQNDINHFTVDEFTMNIRRGLVYLNNYKKVMFGSDWPLVDLKGYINFIKALIPKEHQEDVFYNNAKEVFKLRWNLFHLFFAKT